MATKYILVGGYPKRASDGGKAFCKELVKDYDEPIKILECLFARPEDMWEKSFREDKLFFEINLPNKKLEFKQAEVDNFSEQVKWANCVYIRGGASEDLLLRLLQGNREWIRKLDGKTFAGSSAGADIISKYFYDLDGLKLKEGLGLLPIKTLVHYCSNYNAPNIDWDKACSELKEYKENLPVVMLAEGEFKVFNRYARNNHFWRRRKREENFISKLIILTFLRM